MNGSSFSTARQTASNSEPTKGRADWATLLVVASVFYFIAVIIIAHFFVPAAYQWQYNTISDLAAQGLPYQWIMQAGFIGFGLLLNAGLVGKSVAARKLCYADVPIMLYGWSVLLSGMFSTRPFLPTVIFSAQEDAWHSFFAQAAGIFFTLGIMAHLATARSGRWFHLMFLLLVIGASLLFMAAANGTVRLGIGLAQRLLYLVSFLWLVGSQR